MTRDINYAIIFSMNAMLKGVYLARKKDNSIYYRASITYRRKHISLGSFDTEDSANRAYEEADRLLRSETDTIDSYENTCALPFEKWVILLNFRDNGLYFATPIYVFFYSSHKIMKRGEHLFVADYGMQLNILNRHGIRSYSVPGRDYVFLNGDETDFRSANLKIINRYQGVLRIESKGRTRYKARINLPGYYIIGTYATEDEAAIAYNKAIDILRKNGVTRNYTPNYLEGLSPAVYADIYARLKISDKIYNYFLE